MGKTPVRYPNGVGIVPSKDPLALLPVPAHFVKLYEWFDDFDNYVATDWVVTVVQAGAGSAAVGTVPDVAHGVFKITNDDLDDDSVFLQWEGNNTGAMETFKFVAGKKLWFDSRILVDEATQSDLVIGLQITDTTPLSVTDGVYIRKDDGDALLDLVCVKNSTASTATGMATLVAAVWTRLSFYYNGVDRIFGYKDGSLVGSVPVTNLPDDEELTISFGFQNGSAGAKNLSVDYIYAAVER